VQKHNLTEREQRYMTKILEAPMGAEKRKLIEMVAPELSGKKSLNFYETYYLVRKTIEMENEGYEGFGKGFSPF